MMKIRRVYILLSVIFLVEVFAGCGVLNQNSEKKVNPVTANEETKDRIKLSFCLSSTGWGGEAVDPELMDEVKKVIENKTNTVLEVIAPSQNSYNEKLNLMLLSGQIPDIYAVRKAMDNIQVMAPRGYNLPLDELVSKTPEITTLVDKKYLDYLRVNGKLQAVPMYLPLSKVIWLRKDMMEKNGVVLSSTPTTEEFYEEMKKLVGKGIVPFTFAKFLDNLPFFFNPFGAYYGIGIQNGKYIDGFNTKEAKAALAYIAKLYKENIWDQEFLTNENSSVREKLVYGKAASILDYYNRYIYFSSESEKAGTFTEFFPVYELKGPKGFGGNLNEAIQDAICISAKCKTPQKAMDVIKYYFYSEEGIKLRVLGVKDKHYSITGGVIRATDKAKNSGYKGDINQFFLYYPQIKDFGFKWGGITENLIPQQIKYITEAKKHLGPKYLVPGGRSNLYDKNLSAYKKKIDEVSSKIIMGSVSVDKGFTEYVDFWNGINGDEMLKQLNMH